MSEQANKDKEDFLLERVAFDKALGELNNRKAPHLQTSLVFSITLTLLLTVVTTKEYVAVLGIPSEAIRTIIIILLIVSLIVLMAFFLIKKYHFKKQNKYEILTVDLVKNTLEKYSEKLNSYNVLFIIPNFNKSELSLLARKHTQWQNAIFLPSVQYEFKEEWDKLDNLDAKIRKHIIADFNFRYEYLNEMDIYNEVKYHKDEQHLRRYNYKFVLLYPKSNFLIDVFLRDIKERLNFTFFDIDYIKNDMSSMMRNSEVIEKLVVNRSSLLQKITILNRGANRIVWNISKQCGESCEFCAFGNSTSEDFISHLDIKQLIEKLSAIKLDMIDISTGDKINIDYLKNCIFELNKAGYKVHLTATAKIIDSLDPEFISANISMIEFSYDSLDSANHRSKNYNESNYSCISSLSKKLPKNQVAFKALIILYSHLRFKTFRDIINKLVKINVSDVTLIRLMPVGHMSNREYPKKLMDKKFYNDYIKFKTGNNMKIVSHCSFDGLKDIKFCNRGITKLSMSPSGDVYDCPWGEHLSEGRDSFYLGNILTDDIVDIIKKRDFPNMESEKFVCEIFNVSQGEDFLYK